MSISEDKIIGCMNMLLESSDAGDVLHHLHVVAAPNDAVGPLGTVDEDKLGVYVYAIAYVPVPDIGPEEFVAQSILAAGIDHTKEGRAIMFAGLSQEFWVVDPMDDLGRQLRAAGRLYEHPQAAEVTVVYGATRDGRRWRGRRWLTGPKAGTSTDVEMLVGRPSPREGFGLPAASLIRSLVGMKEH